MLIDWFTIIAQIINFLILVGLIKYVEYDGVLHAKVGKKSRFLSFTRC